MHRTLGPLERRWVLVLGIGESEHINKFKYFNPDVSIRNVGIWKKHKNQDEMNKIYTELTEYCYLGT